ncbi:MAG: hypothetical protein LBR21_02395 [Propionibacteriaceae bacterium]|jgi:hypothetical protein|nr:hypothetical protein [Propionibacteriaceae bacterium]
MLRRIHQLIIVLCVFASTLSSPPAHAEEPVEPAAITLTSIGAKRNVISATGPAGKYQFQVKTGNGKWKRISDVQLTDTAKLTHSFPKTSLGKALQYRLVRFKTSTSAEIPSNTVSLTAGKTSLSASGASGKIKLSWSKLTSVKGYRIEAKISGKWVKVANVSKSKTSLTVTKIKGKSLSLAASYSFRIVGCSKLKKGKCTKLKNRPWAKAGARPIDTASLELTQSRLDEMLTTTYYNKEVKLLYSPSTNLNSTAEVFARDNGMLPYIKLVWNPKGVLEIHAYIEFKVTGKADKQRSAAKVKSLVRAGIKLWGGQKVVGNTKDFGSGTSFTTKVVLHERSNAKAEGHSAQQFYLTIQIGGNGQNLTTVLPGGKRSKPVDCYLNWISDCGSGAFGSTQGSFLYFPWLRSINEAKTGNRQRNSVSFKLIVAHEFGHALRLGDAYPADHKMLAKSEAQYFPDRMYENSETTTGSNYRNLMYHDWDFKIGSGSNARIRQPLLTANDIEMVVIGHAQQARSGGGYYQRYADMLYCSTGWVIKNKKATCKDSWWRSSSVSCAIQDTEDKRISYARPKGYTFEAAKFC